MSSQKISLLIINPNSSDSVTQSLAEAYKTCVPPETAVAFLTAPPHAPPAINDNVTGEQSAKACLPLCLPLLEQHDGFLVACYSAHPLVPLLRQHTRKPVIGIFESSVTHALLRCQRFGIVTTGPTWEKLLSDAVAEFLGAQSSKFVGVKSTGLGVLELHSKPAAEVESKLCEAALELVDKGADGICLGCAGMAGIGEAIQKAVGTNVAVIDIHSGLWELAGLVMCQSS